MIYNVLSNQDETESYFVTKKSAPIFCYFPVNVYFCTRKTKVTGCSSARLEYASGGRVVAGSNPVTPTGENEGVK